MAIEECGYSMLRTAFVSLDLLDLLCDGSTHLSDSSLGDIVRYSGLIIYLVVTCLVLLASWSRLTPARYCLALHANNTTSNLLPKEDVLSEANTVSESKCPLHVLHVTKSLGTTGVLKDVSLGILKDTGKYFYNPGHGKEFSTFVSVFGLLGPNGAGKTTTFNVIRSYLPLILGCLSGIHYSFFFPGGDLHLTLVTYSLTGSLLYITLVLLRVSWVFALNLLPLTHT